MSEHNEEKINSLRHGMMEKMKKFDRPIYGYQPPPEPERKEGDEWTDSNGKRWTVKNGIKQSISKTAKFRMPWWCPKCQKAMNHRFDRKFWNLYGYCYNCAIEEHTKMRIEGTWDVFERKTIRENEKAYLKTLIEEYKDYMKTFRTPQVHFEDGRWDEIAPISQFESMFNNMKQDIEICERKLKEIEEEEKEESKQ
jgi:hypothetical protein